MVGELEKKVAKLFNVKYAIAMNSGTSALHASLGALGIGEGDEVICPALTVIMNTFSILYQKATPIYVDVDPDTFNIDPTLIEAKITPRTKAIMIVSLYGLPCNIDAIMDIARRHKIPIIEDDAECVMGYYNNNKIVGSVADMSILSFESSKHLNCGEGGMLLTNNSMLAMKARKFAGLGYATLTAEEGRPKLDKSIFQNPDFKRHDMLGYNYRMPEACAKLLMPQIDEVSQIVNLRTYSAYVLDSVIKHTRCDWLVPQYVPEQYFHSYWAFTVRYEGALDWISFHKYFVSKGGDGFYATWQIPYLEPVMMDYYNEFTRPSCQVAEWLQPKLMQFKTNYKTYEDADKQGAILKQVILDLKGGY